MINFEVFIKSYFAIICVLAIVYILGGFVRKITSDSFKISAYNIFFNFVIGIVCLVFFYSIIMTQGMTVSWLYLLLGIMYLYHKKKLNGCIKDNADKANQSKKSNLKIYIGLLLFWSVTIYIYLFISNCSFDGSYFRPVEVDNYHYATLSRYLNKGYECMNIQAVITGNFKLSPYHYGESWITAFILKIFDLNHLYVYSVVVQCIVLTILLFGFLTVWEKTHTKLSFYVAGFVFLLFVTDMAYIYKLFISSEYIYGENRAYIFIMLKQSFLAIFMLASVVLFMEKKYNELFYSLLLILPVFFFAVPAIGGIIAGAFIMYYIKNKKVPWSYLLSSVIFITIYGIYAIIGSVGLQDTANTDMLSSIPWYKMRLLITNLILYFVLYIHFVILILLVCSMKTVFNFVRKYWIPILSFWICTIVISVIIRGYNGIAMQFISSIFSSLLAVCIPVVLLYFWDNIKIYANVKKYAVYALTILSFAVGVYSINCIMSRQLYPIKQSRQTYEKEVVSFIKDSKPLNIGVMTYYPKFDFTNNFVVNYGTF